MMFPHCEEQFTVRFDGHPEEYCLSIFKEEDILIAMFTHFDTATSEMIYTPQPKPLRTNPETLDRFAKETYNKGYQLYFPNIVQH